jgi:hypothetical protein
MLKLQEAKQTAAGELRVTYQLVDPKAKAGAEGAALPIVALISAKDGASAELLNQQASAPDEEAAFEALATMLEQAARAIRGRGEPSVGIPVYG